MRRLLTLALLLMAGCATDPLAQLETATPTLSPAQVAELRKRALPAEALGLTPKSGREIDITGQETVTLPLVKVATATPREPGGRHRVPVIIATVNHKPGVRVLLDSGSNGNFFGYSLAHHLGLPVIADTRPSTSFGIGGAVDNYLGVVRSVQFGALELQHLVTLIGPDVQVLRIARPFWGDAQVMILGVGTLRPLSYLGIDSPAGTVTFAPREEYRPRPTARFVTTVPLRWVNGLPFVDITLTGKTYPCVLDTGGDYGLLVPRQHAAKLGYWTPGQGKLGASRGIGGAALATSYEVPEARVGNATFVKVPARTDLIGPEVAGGNILLGNIVLRTCRVTFDFRRGVLWIER